MATDIRSLASYQSTDAQFRNWAQGVDAQLLACGLVAAADTGQVDLATAARPVGGGIMAGYKMYRFDDSLQATKPVFIKVEYGNSSFTNAPALTLRVGTQTNGAGTLIGVTLTATQLIHAGAAKGVGEVLNSYCSGSQAGAGGGRIWLTTNFDSAIAQFGMTFCVERLKNGDGTVHSSGAVFVGSAACASGQQCKGIVLIHGTSSPTHDTEWPTIGNLPIAGQHSPNVGTDLALAPFMFSLGVWLYIYPLYYRDVDLTKLTTFTMSHLGASRTFMPLGPNISSGIMGSGGASQASQGIAVLWE